MTYCGPICNFPCGVGYGLGGYYGGAGSCALVPVCGGGALTGVGSGAGVLSGIGAGVGYGAVTCTGQLSGSEVVIQPPPSVVSIPGPRLSASTEPVAVAQITPCSYGYSALGSSGGYYSGSSYLGSGRLGYGGYCGGYGGGYGGWRRYSRRCLPSYSYGSCGPC